LWRPTPTPLQRACDDARAALLTLIALVDVIAELGADSRLSIDRLDALYRSPDGSVLRLLRLARSGGHELPRTPEGIDP
jgi:hypothetical protein